MSRGRIVILSGPSGAGKDSVIDAWAELDHRVERVVAATTRAPRPGEEDGIDYRFLAEEEFLQWIDADGFLEHKLVHGRRYGTPRQSVEEIVERGGIAVLKIDVQGAEAILEQGVPCLAIFLAPPSMEELERRLRARATETEEQIARRMAAAEEEMARSEMYRHVVVNRDIHEAAEAIRLLVEAG
jgi:guanylate kinase